METIDKRTVHAPRSARSRLVLGSLLALGLIVATSTTMAAKVPSAASHRSPNRATPALALPNGAAASTAIACSQTMHWMRRTVTIRPQSSYSSQAITWRSYIQPVGGTGFWTAWVSGTAPYAQVSVANISNANLTVYQQYAWWSGGAWSYAGEWIRTYTQVRGMASWTLGYCAV